MLVVHTREGHLPDLSDAPPAKVERGKPSLRIGDPGPMGRILIRGEAGHDIIPELYPLSGEVVIDKPGKGAFYATALGETLQKAGIENLLVCGVTTEVCVNTTVREANDRGYRCVVTADGVVSLIGCLMGNPFINAVYIGHPGWKAMGGRIGYSAVTGIMVVLLSWFGIISVLLALVPVVAISPILLYIGMLIGAQAFQTTPTHHAPAIALALTPHLAAWAKTLIDGALGAAGTTAAAVGFDKMAMQGVVYHGLEVLGGGAILSGLILGAIGVFIVDREFVKASAFALAGAILTFFGFMHGEAVGFAVSPSVALAYGLVAVFLYGMSRQGLGLTVPAPAAKTAATPAE